MYKKKSSGINRHSILYSDDNNCYFIYLNLFDNNASVIIDVGITINNKNISIYW